MRTLASNGLAITLLAVTWIPSLKASEADDASGSGLLHVLREDAAVDQLGVSESYQESVELEKEIARLYREIRATRLSRIQRQSLRMSLRQTLIPISDRPAPDTEVLHSNAKNGDDIARYQDALRKLMQENEAIVSNAEEMLLSLQPETRDESPPGEHETTPEELAQEQAAETEPQQMAELIDKAGQQMEAAADSLDTALAEVTMADSMLTEMLEAARKNGPQSGTEQKESSELKEKLSEAKDLVKAAVGSISEKKADASEMLEQAREAVSKIEKALTSTAEVNGDLQQKKQTEPQLHTEKAVAALTEAREQMAAASQAAAAAKAAGQSGAHNQEIAKQRILENLARAEAGTYLDLTKQMKGQGLGTPHQPVAREDYPPAINKTFKGISGRTFVKQGGTPAVWFHVNKWYILGPYDNRGRMNLQRVYPPQSIIDLDASYPGKDGTLLTWAYDSFVNEMVNPSTGRGEYTIYYGFTEVFFEEEAETWIAVGSDDRSDLWINDMPVWHSSDKLKIWNIGEGYRKVHFKKGRNKLVFRLENGWQNLGFSLLINTQGSNSVQSYR